MPVAHCYLNASDNIGQYMADQCGRQAMAVEEFFGGNAAFADLTLYRFNEENHEVGLDPWSIVSLDAYTEPKDPAKPFIMENASGTKTWPVSGDEIVFVSKKLLEKMGVAIPAKTNPKGKKRVTQPERVLVRFTFRHYLLDMRRYLDSRIELLDAKIAKFQKAAEVFNNLHNELMNIDGLYEAVIRRKLLGTIRERMYNDDPPVDYWTNNAKALREEAANLARSMTKSTSVTSNLFAHTMTFVYNDECGSGGIVPLIEELAKSQIGQSNQPADLLPEVAEKMIAEGRAVRV